jgi:hypothetical protein
MKKRLKHSGLLPFVLRHDLEAFWREYESLPASERRKTDLVISYKLPRKRRVESSLQK